MLCARTSAYRWGVYASQRCEDAIAESAQVVVHTVGVGGEGAPNLSEVLAWRFERHVPRIDGSVFGLRNDAASVDGIQVRRVSVL
jgi:hypothetical protein